ncbi:hypothetical protein, partial [Lacimonas salitolerans]
MEGHLCSKHPCFRLIDAVAHFAKDWRIAVPMMQYFIAGQALNSLISNKTEIGLFRGLCGWFGFRSFA